MRHRAEADDGVPVVGRGNAHGVDRLVFRDLAEVVGCLAVRVFIFFIDIARDNIRVNCKHPCASRHN